MAYKKITVILSVLSVMLVLIFFIVSCSPKNTAVKNTEQGYQSADLSAIEAAESDSSPASNTTTSSNSSTSPDSSTSLNSTDDSGSQSSSSSGASSDANNKQTPEISVIGVLTADGSRSGILLISEGGEKITALTDGVYNNSGPVFSPDKSKIAFYSNIEGDYDIYTINLCLYIFNSMFIVIILNILIKLKNIKNIFCTIILLIQ